MNLDYEALRLIHLGLLIFSLLGFAVFNGISLGATLLLPFLENTTDKQKVVSSITPNSLSLQTWLLVVVALLFAAWPIAFAVLFSSLQWILVLLLLAWLSRTFILFVLAKSNDTVKIQGITKKLAVSAYIFVILLGIVAGNILKGIPFHLDSDMRIIFLGDFSGYFNPFSVFVSVACVGLFLFYGTSYIQYKSDALAQTCQPLLMKSGTVFLLTFTLAGLWLMHLEGYHINSEILPNADSNPLTKFVKRNEGLWLDNYEHLPFLWAIPIIGILATIASLILAKHTHYRWAFVSSCFVVLSSVLTIAISLFPFLLPSNRSLNSSLTIWDASASFNSLLILLWLTAITLLVMFFSSYLANKQ